MPRSFTKNIILKTFFLTLCCSHFIVDAQMNSINYQTDYKHESVADTQKTQYHSRVPESIKHKFGYEHLDETKSFHHTTTEDDGVRLGCYGYILHGKKYSTQYVADTKGYRVVYTHDPIDVYPTSGGSRKASFVGQFNEDEKKSQNIRFFFPDGCQGQKATVSVDEQPSDQSSSFVAVAPVIATASSQSAVGSSSVVAVAPVIATASSQSAVESSPVDVDVSAQSSAQSSSSFVEVAPAVSETTQAITSAPIPLTTLILQAASSSQAHFSDEIANSNANANDHCQCQSICDANANSKSTYSMIPVQLKSGGEPCDKFDYLTIPIGVLSVEDLKEINDLLKSKINSY